MTTFEQFFTKKADVSPTVIQKLRSKDSQKVNLTTWLSKMNKFLKYCFLILGWGFVILSLLFLSVFKNTDKAALFGSIGAFILFLQSIVEIKKDEAFNKSIDIVGRKLNIIYIIVSILLFILYFI